MEDSLESLEFVSQIKELFIATRRSQVDGTNHKVIIDDELNKNQGE